MIMKKQFFSIKGLFICCFLIIGYGCDEEKENTEPICSIVTPISGVEVIKGEIVSISVEAGDEDGNLKEVRFYANGSEISVDSSFPYSYEWNTNEVTIGVYILKAVAIDEENATAEDIVNITIIAPISVTDYDGNIYETVKIGDQIWMAENLKTTHYADGTEITLVESNTVWENLLSTDKVYCYYENSTTNSNTYGALYNWAAIMNGAAQSNAVPSGVQGVCPDGWHIPSDDEWKILEGIVDSEFNVDDSEWDDMEWRGYDVGKNLKSKTNWSGSGNGTDLFGFGSLPAGTRNYLGEFANLGLRTSYWTTGRYLNYHDAWIRFFEYGYDQSWRAHYSIDYGYSVRCIKD